MRTLVLLLLAVTAPSASIIAWSQSAQTITVHLSNFEFSPDQIHLRAGAPIRLQLINDSTGGHDFSAPAFFAASSLVSGVAPRDGMVDVPARGIVELTVVPRTPGSYRLKCTHFLHSLFGMTGTIVVEAVQPK